MKSLQPPQSQFPQTRPYNSPLITARPVTQCDDKVRVPAKAPGILAPDECEKLLNAAGSELLPSLAIQAFCGVRSADGSYEPGHDLLELQGSSDETGCGTLAFWTCRLLVPDTAFIGALDLPRPQPT